jgi:hypothetical protein
VFKNLVLMGLILVGGLFAAHWGRRGR